MGGESDPQPGRSDELRHVMAAGLREARSAWPALRVAEDDLLAFVAERTAPDTSAASLHAADLCLAFGCASGDAGAIAVLDREYLPRLDGLLRRARIVGLDVGDLRQLVRVRLLVSDGAGPPAIARYGGRAPLTRWLRVVAARLVADAARTERARGRTQAIEDADAAADPGLDPEMALTKASIRRAFTTALSEALGELTVRQRNLLRHQMVHGLTLDAIAGLYGIHRATVARHLDEARHALVDRTRGRLMTSLTLGRAEAESALRLVMSSLDVTLRRVLGTGTEKGVLG